MPLYVYECELGHRTEQLRSVEHRNEPMWCNQDTGLMDDMSYCGSPMRLVPAAANPQVSGGTPKFYHGRN